MGEEDNQAYSGLETCNLNNTTATSADMFVDECRMLANVFFHICWFIRAKNISIKTVTACDKLKFDLASVLGQNKHVKIRTKKKTKKVFFVCL